MIRTNWAYKLEQYAALRYRKKILNRTKKSKIQSPPSYILWDCTRRCNLKCEHCGATKETYDRELSSEEIKKVISELRAMKTRMFSVTGGEPFMRKDVLDVLSFAHSQGLKTGIATNGFFIDKPMVKKIKEAGVDSIQISLDGLEKTHNTIRGDSQSFQRAIQALQYLQEIDLPVLSVATTITKNNFRELEKIWDLLVDLQVKIWRISVVMPIGRAEIKDQFLLDTSQMNHLFAFIEENSKPLEIRIAENLPYLAHYEERIRREPFLCPVGITACCIGVDGNVRGCPEQPDIPDFIEGNVLQNSIADIWQYGFKKYRCNETLFKDETCKHCVEKYRCFGGCYVMRIGNIHCIYNLI
ncbi:MAG: radical SAM protein [Euryarchaeota archaeon]|nr:radical SAM protein [Euryarchaeota archaeon]